MKKKYCTPDLCVEQASMENWLLDISSTGEDLTVGDEFDPWGGGAI